jgi:nitrate reductase cytochrome c-type subunit
MRCSLRTRLIALLAPAATLFGSACGDRWVDVPDADGAVKSGAAVRAERRAYDGAPPVIPHASFGADCSACHDTQGIAVEGVGFAPASPHEGTNTAGNTLRCRQCHVFHTTDDVFVESQFIALRQDLRAGDRLNPIAPPTIPHRTLMRENCVACHSGAAAREDIRTSHPERTRCRQCHVAVTTTERFDRELGAGLIAPDSTH